MTIDVVSRREDLPQLAARWDELAREDARDGFFRTFVWYQAWLQHVRPDAEPFVVVVRDEAGVVVGLAPLCLLVRCPKPRQTSAFASSVKRLRRCCASRPGRFLHAGKGKMRGSLSPQIFLLRRGWRIA